MHTNPVIPGFHPDPSICRRGSDYYLVNSSFEYYPGIPIFHSRNLVHWEPVGYVLNRPSQLPLEGAYSSGGVYAPTIRYANERFYVTSTNTSHGGNFIVTAQEPEGPWSEPIYVQQGGIDPSLFFDEDGAVYFLSVGYDEEGQGIIMSRIQPDTGEIMEKARMIWHGTGDRYPEGAHLYRIGEYYYLMIAEGGTEFTHAESIARSAHPYGPYESCPMNPILTTRRDPAPVLCGVGHADLIEAEDGQWWAVFHGYRHNSFMFHHLGRETCAAPVQWEDGWPVITRGKQPYVQLPPVVPPDKPYRWDLLEDPLTAYRPEWCYLRNPDPAAYQFTPGGLKLSGGGPLSERISPTLYLLRQTAFDLTFTVDMELLQSGENAECGLSIFYNDNAHYDFFLTSSAEGYMFCLKKHVGDMEFISHQIPWEQPRARLRIEADRLTYRFYAESPDASHRAPCGSARTLYVSTEATPHSFTGVMIGLYALGQCQALYSHAHMQANPPQDA